jgi:hypothetical protein
MSAAMPLESSRAVPGVNRWIQLFRSLERAPAAPSPDGTTLA